MQKNFFINTLNHLHKISNTFSNTEKMPLLFLGQIAIPTPDHYLPLIYTLGLKDKTEELSLFNDKLVAGSLSMTSVKIM
jgi:aromatic ring-opening dioxygenase catalytic subunit (LigB family)